MKRFIATAIDCGWSMDVMRENKKKFINELLREFPGVKWHVVEC